MKCIVYMVSDSGHREYFDECSTKAEALEIIESHEGHIIDENGYDWDLIYTVRYKN